ncbi:MAG: sensor histidine kinase, partial [Acutalibacteraceae bacterium]
SFKGYMGHVYDRFDSLTKNLERQQKNQQRIIASISHDIKTPLTSIMGYTERLKKDNIPPERRERYLDTVYNKSLEIRGLVDEFDEYLGYNMSDKVDSVRLSTKQFCEQIIAEYADELENSGVKFEVINNAQKAYITIDKPKTNRVIGNIVSNSLKHFKGEAKHIRVTLSERKNSVYIVIADNGEGVTEDKLELIFEPLYTSDEGRKVAGLGLAICREIIESHGGTVHAEKSELGGLAICIELPKT